MRRTRDLALASAGVVLLASAPACGPTGPDPMDGGGSGSGTTTVSEGGSSTGPSASPGCPELIYNGTLLFTTLAETENVPLYTEVTGAVSVGVEGLRDLNFLRCLTVVGSDPDDVGGIGIGLSHELETLQGLERLERVDNLSIAGMDGIRSLVGLENLRVVLGPEDPKIHDRSGLIRIDNNPLLETIHLPALEETRVIEIGDTVPGTLISPDPAPGIWECVPDGNPSLVDIRFDALQRFDAIVVVGNEALASVDSFAALAGATTVTEGATGPGIGLRQNPSLPIADIEAVWTAMGPDPLRLYTCGNQDDSETCECYCCGP